MLLNTKNAPIPQSAWTGKRYWSLFAWLIRCAYSTLFRTLQNSVLCTGLLLYTSSLNMHTQQTMPRQELSPDPFFWNHNFCSELSIRTTHDMYLVFKLLYLWTETNFGCHLPWLVSNKTHFVCHDIFVWTQSSSTIFHRLCQRGLDIDFMLNCRNHFTMVSAVWDAVYILIQWHPSIFTGKHIGQAILLLMFQRKLRLNELYAENQMWTWFKSLLDTL